jgi:zinc transport system substrate-binding protein
MVLRKAAIPVIVVALLASCGGDDDDDASANGKLDVVASFYPLAWLAEEIGGDRVEVTDLTPTGGEPHDLELSPDQVDEIENADLVIVMGNGFQPSVEEAAESHAAQTLSVLDDGADDPHAWLDLQQMQRIAGIIGSALRIEPESITRELAALDREFREGLERCERRTIVTAHDAFSSLAARYDLDQVAIAGIEPNQEPGADRFAQVADVVEREGVTTVFVEPLVESDVAETLARETEAKVRTLNPIEGLTEEQRDAGEDYFSLMRENLSQLREALGCAG